MRTMLRGPDGRWTTEAAPESAEELSKWMFRHDAMDAVVADDQSEVYYCGNDNTLQLFRSKGKNAEMFLVLARRL